MEWPENITEDDVLTCMMNGISQNEIARSIGVDSMTISRWLNSDPLRAARAREARRASAEAWLDKAEQVLLDVPDDAGQTAFAKARELSALYRKNAAIRNPAEYGDKIDITGKVEHQHQLASVDLSAWSNRCITRVATDAILIDGGNNSGNTGHDETDNAM